MSDDRRQQLSSFLAHLGESLDISEARFKEAEERYLGVSDWLGASDSDLAPYSPSLYTQGSFCLGTVVRPTNDGDQYDIDLVCELKGHQKTDVTQEQLKRIVGDRLKQSPTYNRMLEEGKRCWTLEYAESARFHMDILPAIPDQDIDGIARMIGTDLARSAILITDKELREWQHSNPAGYAEWFKERMSVQFDARRMALAESIRASVEDVPEYKVKTPLQRSIQILKRHRDVMFPSDEEDRPISIIVTTLAAHAYSNEADILDALQTIVNKMPGLIERDEQGKAIVANPVNPLENFADRWQKHPQREAKFLLWLQQVQADLNAALRSGDVRGMTEVLRPRFGDRVVNEAAKEAFPSRFGAGSTAAAAAAIPQIVISNPSKPWGA